MNQSTSFQPAGTGEIAKIQKKYQEKKARFRAGRKKTVDAIAKKPSDNTEPAVKTVLYGQKQRTVAKKDHELSIAIMNQKYYPKIQKVQLKLSKLTQQYQKKLESTRKKVEKALKQEKLNDLILKNFEAEKNKIQLQYDVKQDELRQSYQKLLQNLSTDLKQYQQNWVLRQKDGTTAFEKVSTDITCRICRRRNASFGVGKVEKNKIII